MRSSTSFSIVAGVFFLCMAPAYAQYTTASFGGNVVDSENAVLPQSQVIVRNVDTGFTQSATTDESGAFLFPRLPVGSYELRVERPGFSRYVRTGITLTVDQAATLTVVMQIGQVSEEVTVEADAELVGTRNGAKQQRVVGPVRTDHLCPGSAHLAVRPETTVLARDGLDSGGPLSCVEFR